MEPWQRELAQGNAGSAWDLYAERYRRLILATIRRLVPDHDDVMDVFSTVCQSLTASDCARLKRYSDESARRASVATWTVVVVRNLTVDWLRHQDGRRHGSVPAHLAPLQQAIYRAICIDGSSVVEAYESIRARAASALTFAEFLRETRATHAVAPCPRQRASRHVPVVRLLDSTAAPSFDPAEAAELAERVAGALASQPPDVRLAVELFVVERMPAADVARVLGWPNAKAVYNRVSRALQSLRTSFARDGIGPADL